MIKVLMINDKYRRNYDASNEEARLHLNEGHFVTVASVYTYDLDEAWDKTQNIFSPWTDNARVYNHNYKRSTMVGDIFVKDNKFYKIGSFGFDEI